MFLAIELFAILLLMAIGQGVLEVAPHAARRVAVTLAAWVFAFAVGAAILSVRRVAADVVAIGLALLAGYILWWIGAGIVRHFRGPVFFEPPKAGELGELAQQAGLPAGDCRKIARRLLKTFDGSVALLGLLSLSGSGDGGAEEFERAWDAASEKSLAQAGGIPFAGPGRSNMLFVAQALCLYEKESVERVCARLAAKNRQGRAARVEAAEQLAQSGRERKEARRFGLTAPLKNVRDSNVASGTELEPVDILWPPMGLVRCGFQNRAAALAVSHGVLVAYGVLALALGRSSGWVFLAAAVLVHVQALFAIGDFAWLQAHGAAGAEKGARTP
ncbi:MAG: hypothetical protein ACLQVA_11585 [Candidatus Brocadiia bacterium]